MCTGVMWVGDVTAPMKLAPVWDKVLPWAVACHRQPKGGCHVPDSVQPYVWGRVGEQEAKLMVQFAKPLPQGVWP